MSDPINEWLDEVQARIDAATPGPLVAVDLDAEIHGETVTGAGHGWWWVWEESKKPHYGGVLETLSDFTIRGADDGRLYHVAGAVGEGVVSDGTTPQARKDVEFFAAARTDLPRAVEALRKVMVLPPKDVTVADTTHAEAWRSGYNNALADVARTIRVALGLDP